MAEPESKSRPILRRRVAPIGVLIVALPDATARVSRVTPLMVRDQSLAKLREASEQQAKRNEYRAKRLAENKANGIYFSIPMSNEQIDQALAQEAAAANQSQLGLGLSEEEYQAQRESRELAQRLAELHNASFLGGMVAPSISPEMAAANPEYVLLVVRGDAGVLPYAFTSGLSFGAPSLTSAVASGARQGWQTAGNMANRAWSAATQGVRAATPVVTNPRWAATTSAFMVPAVAEAADGERSAAGVTAELALLTGLGVGAIKGGTKAYKGVKGKMFPDKGTPPTVVTKPTTMVEKAPKKVTSPATRVYEKPKELPATATDAEKQAYNEALTNYEKTLKFQDYVTNLRAYRNTKDYNSYVKAQEAYDKIPESAKKWRNRAWWAIPGGLGLMSAGFGLADPVGKMYKDIFPNSMFRSLWSDLPTTEQSTLTTQGSELSTGSVPTTTPVIEIGDSPYTEGTNVDSILSVLQGVPYIPANK